MRATMAEQISIHAKLAEVCKAVEGIAIYSEGWDDARVVKEVAPRLGPQHVAYVRKQMGFGNLRISTPQASAALLEDIEELKRFIAELIRSLDRLTKQYTELSNRVRLLEQPNVEPIRKV